MVKQHKNTDANRDYIHHITTAFYTKAVSDVVIGYHFRKIATMQGHHPLKPPIEAFSDHIPRIVDFWSMQLLQAPLPEGSEPFDLIDVHRQLSLRLGELGRWITLFKETLDEEPDHELKVLWLEKVDHFESIFKRKLFG